MHLARMKEKRQEKQFGIQSSPRALPCPSCLHVNCRGTELVPSWCCALTQAPGQGQRELSPVLHVNFKMDFNRFQQRSLPLYQCEENLFWIWIRCSNLVGLLVCQQQCSVFTNYGNCHIFFILWHLIYLLISMFLRALKGQSLCCFWAFW